MSLEDRKQELEDYLYGRLSPEEEREFLARLRTMIQLREALMAYTPPADAPDEAEHRLRVLRRKYGGPQPMEWRIIQPKLAAIWGLIALLILLGWNVFYAYLHYTDAALAQHYYYSPPDTIKPDLPEMLETALRQIREKDYAAGLESIQSISAESPNYAGALFWKAHAHFKLQEYGQTVTTCDELLEASTLPDYTSRQWLEWNCLLARLVDGDSEADIRRQLALFSESESYDPVLREKARQLEKDLGSLYHQLLAD